MWDKQNRTMYFQEKRNNIKILTVKEELVKFESIVVHHHISRTSNNVCLLFSEPEISSKPRLKKRNKIMEEAEEH